MNTKWCQYSRCTGQSVMVHSLFPLPKYNKYQAQWVQTERSLESLVDLKNVSSICSLNLLAIYCSVIASPAPLSVNFFFGMTLTCYFFQTSNLMWRWGGEGNEEQWFILGSSECSLSEKISVFSQLWTTDRRSWWFVLATQRESRDSALKTRQPASCCVQAWSKLS